MTSLIPSPSATTAAAARAGNALSGDTVATSFATFEPVGHVMVGLPTAAAVDALVQALHGAGWAPESLLRFAPADSVAELQALIDQAGPLAGFGFEITALRRYLALAEQGHGWLLVKVDGPEQAAQVAELARAGGATLAHHYRSLVVEELL